MSRKSFGSITLVFAIILFLLWFVSMMIFNADDDIQAYAITSLFISMILLVLSLYLLKFAIPNQIANFFQRIFIFLVMVGTVLGGIGIFSDMGIPAFGWIFLFLTIEFLLYKYRWLRIFIYWTIVGFPLLVIISMGMFRMPSFRDFTKYMFPFYRTRPSTKDDSATALERGFTLIELLIVIAILAIVSTGILHIYGMTMMGLKHLELKNQAVLMAQSELEQLHTQPFSNATSKGAIVLSERTQNWVKILPDGKGTVVLTPYKNTTLREAHVTIQWMEGTHNQSVDLSTLLGEGAK